VVIQRLEHGLHGPRDHGARHPKKSHGLLRAGISVKCAWITSNKTIGRRKALPQPSKPGSHKRMSDEALLIHIRAIHAEVKAEYSWPKMRKELVARGHRVGKERVRRLMQLHGIRARCKRKFVVTNDSKPHLPVAPDLVQRNFTPMAPNQVWTCDITYIATDEG
jgi:putative transposase